MKPPHYLEGLNTLRFVAATLVLIGHARHHLLMMGIPYMQDIPLFAQGGKAVNFFFTLSGFLLCYLTLTELSKHGKMNFRYFYIRRILRILPLYYLVLFASFFVHILIIPRVTGESLLGFPPLKGLLLCVFMLPNLVSKIWTDTVGSVNILWSIGVEEQFYLFFPLIIWLITHSKNKIRTVLLLYIGYFIFYWVVTLNYLDLPRLLIGFIRTLRFHFMLIGMLFALMLHPYSRQNDNFERLINNFWLQAIILALGLIALFYPIGLHKILRSVYSGVFFAFVIAITSCSTKKRWFALEIKPFVYFGVLSYGIYLMHPLVSYILRFGIPKVDFLNTLVHQFPALYILTLLMLTIWISHLSYRYYEMYFLKFKNKFR